MPHPKCIHALNFYKLYPLPIRGLYAAYGKIRLTTFGKFRLATLWKSSPGHFWKISQLMLASHTRKAHLQNISSVLRFFLHVRWAVQTSTKPRPSKLPWSYLCLYAVIRRYTPGLYAALYAKLHSKNARVFNVI